MNKDLNLNNKDDFDVEKIIAEVNNSGKEKTDELNNAILNETLTPKNSAPSPQKTKSIIDEINKNLNVAEKDEFQEEKAQKKSNKKESTLYDPEFEKVKQNAKVANNTEHTKPKKKKGKGKRVALFIIGIIIILLAACYLIGYAMASDTFLPNTYVNDIGVSGMNISEAKTALESSKENLSTLVIEKNDGTTITIPYEKIDFVFNTEAELNNIYNSQNKGLWFLNFFNRSDNIIKMTGTFSEEKLKDIIDNASFGVTAPTNAKIVLGDDSFKIVPETEGDIVDTEKVYKACVNAINTGKASINLAEADCYQKPTVVSADLEEKLADLNKIFSIVVKLDFDYTTEDISYKVFKDWITIKKDGTYTIDKDSIWDWIQTIRSKYDTLNKTRKFKSTLQGTVTIKAQKGADGKFDGIFGYFIDADATTETIYKALKAGKSTSVKPTYWTNGGYTYDTMGVVKRSASDEKSVITDVSRVKTYVEVDLTNQHLWYYKNGKVVRECDIVSGYPNAERMTYPGVYQLWMKETNKNMKGSTSDGSYESFCSYWNYISQNSIGIHDATWQSAFGGDRYKYYGSHGCVGISLADAQYFHDVIPIGTMVVMFY